MKEYLVFIKYTSLGLGGLVFLGFVALLILSGGNLGFGFAPIILFVTLVYLTSVFIFAKVLLNLKNPKVILVILLTILVLSPLLIFIDSTSFFNAILPSIDMK